MSRTALTCLLCLGALIGAVGCGGEDDGTTAAELGQSGAALTVIKPKIIKPKIIDPKLLWRIIREPRQLDLNGDGYADVAIGGATDGVQVFHGGASGLSTTPTTTLASPDGAHTAFGAVGVAGDVNGDGYGDLIVGANNAKGAGRVYIFHGSKAGIATKPSTTIDAPAGVTTFGFSVTGGHDFNGDGYADVAVGAVMALDSRGAVYIHLGGTTGVSKTPAYTLKGSGELNANFGYSMTIGYFNEDLYPDIAVGENQYSFGLPQTGRVYVFLGKAGGLSTTPAATLQCPDGPKKGFGVSVAYVNGFTGDGGLVVGAYGVNSNDGRAYLFQGTSTGVKTTPTITFAPTANTRGYFGWTTIAGDFNNDSYADILVGETDALGTAGQVHVYYGGPLPYTVSASNHAVLKGTHSGPGYLGNALAAADVNGDGLHDAVIGAPSADGAAGRVYTFHAKATGLPSTPTTTIMGMNGVGAQFGLQLPH